MFSKIAVALLYYFALILILFFLSWLSFEINIESGANIKLIFLFSMAWLIGGLAFGGLSFLISSFFSYSKSLSSASVILIMVMYMLQVVISLNDKLDWLKYISPFDWFKGSEINTTMSLDITYSLIGFGVFLASIVYGSRRYLKTDVLI